MKSNRSHPRKNAARLKPLRIALAAFPITGNPSHNADQTERLARKAARQRARLVLFAEGALSGYYGDHFFHADEIDDAELDRANRRLADIARRASIYLVAGTLLRQGQRYYNSLVAFSPDGRRLARYDKRHLTSRDHKFYSRGEKPALVRIDGWNVGLLICFDARFPVWSHDYARRRADLLLYSFNMCGRRGLWKRPVMEATLRTRAAENNVFVAAVNDARPFPHIPALAVDRAGRTIARRFLTKPDLVLADLDPSIEIDIEREIVAETPVDYPTAAAWARRAPRRTAARRPTRRHA